MSCTTSYRIELTADLARWRAFVAIAELGSLTSAALFLDANQSLLSRQLNALERECGSRLFTRTGRGVVLSPTGEKILPYARALLEQAEQLDDALREQAGILAGRITLGAFASIGPTLTGRLFQQVTAAFPDLSLHLLEGSTGQMEEWLATGRVDIAILYRYDAALASTEYTLAEVDSYLVGPPDDALTAQREVRFAQLENLPFILPCAPNGLRSKLDHIARQKGMHIAPRIESNSLTFLKQLVEHEGLYTTLPLHSVWPEVCAGRLQAARIVDPVIERSITMAFSSHKGSSKAVTSVSAHIVQIFKELIQPPVGPRQGPGG